MSMISYSQNHEDVVLDRAFPRGKAGFYIDVGANEPMVDSVTHHFYQLGWHGINIEPTPEPFAHLSAARTRDVNLNVGLSDVSGELTFYECEQSAVSTFSAEGAERLRRVGLHTVERKIPTLTLAEVCERHVSGPIDFLSVDVEGHELEVLLGGDWERWRPRVVVVEATEPATTVPSHGRWEPVLLEADYLFAAFDGLNRFYVRQEDAELAAVLAVPANFIDGYVDYRHYKVMEDLRWAAEQSVRKVSATRAMNAALLAEFHGLAGELQVLRSRYERLERSLTGCRAEGEEVRRQAVDALRRAEALEAELNATPAFMEGVSPAAAGIARRLTALSSQHPAAADTVKKGLRLGLKTKRALTGGNR